MEELVKQMEDEAGSVCTYFDTVIQNLQKESKDKFKGWVSLSSTENTDLAYKKVMGLHVSYVAHAIGIT